MSVPILLALAPEALMGIVTDDLIEKGLVVTVSKKRAVVSSSEGVTLAERALPDCCTGHRVMVFMEVAREALIAAGLAAEMRFSTEGQAEAIEQWLKAGNTPSVEA